MRIALVLLASSSFALADEKLPKPEVPDALHGFAGELVGTVVAKYDVGFTLKVDEDYRIEVRNDEGERLHILELSEDQRKAAEEER